MAQWLRAAEKFLNQVDQAAVKLKAEKRAAGLGSDSEFSESERDSGVGHQPARGYDAARPTRREHLGTSPSSFLPPSTTSRPTPPPPTQSRTSRTSKRAPGAPASASSTPYDSESGGGNDDWTELLSSTDKDKTPPGAPPPVARASSLTNSNTRSMSTPVESSSSSSLPSTHPSSRATPDVGQPRRSTSASPGEIKRSLLTSSSKTVNVSAPPTEAPNREAAGDGGEAKLSDLPPTTSVSPPPPPPSSTTTTNTPSRKSEKRTKDAAEASMEATKKKASGEAPPAPPSSLSASGPGTAPSKSETPSEERDRRESKQPSTEGSSSTEERRKEESIAVAAATEAMASSPTSAFPPSLSTKQDAAGDEGGVGLGTPSSPGKSSGASEIAGLIPSTEKAEKGGGGLQKPDDLLDVYLEWMMVDQKGGGEGRGGGERGSEGGGGEAREEVKELGLKRTSSSTFAEGSRTLAVAEEIKKKVLAADVARGKGEGGGGGGGGERGGRGRRV